MVDFTDAENPSLNPHLKFAPFLQILDVDCINIAMDFTAFLDTDWANSCLGCPLGFQHVTFFFFSQHCGIEVFGDYGVDFPFK